VVQDFFHESIVQHHLVNQISLAMAAPRSWEANSSPFLWINPAHQLFEEKTYIEPFDAHAPKEKTSGISSLVDFRFYDQTSLPKKTKHRGL